MIQISLDEMKQDLPTDLRSVEAGETLVIVKAGKLVAELKPITLNSHPKKLSPFGLCAEEFTVPMILMSLCIPLSQHCKQ